MYHNDFRLERQRRADGGNTSKILRSPVETQDAYTQQRHDINVPHGIYGAARRPAVCRWHAQSESWKSGTRGPGPAAQAAVVDPRTTADGEPKARTHARAYLRSNRTTAAAAADSICFCGSCYGVISSDGDAHARGHVRAGAPPSAFFTAPRPWQMRATAPFGARRTYVRARAGRVMASRHRRQPPPTSVRRRLSRPGYVILFYFVFFIFVIFPPHFVRTTASSRTRYSLRVRFAGDVVLTPAI